MDRWNRKRTQNANYYDRKLKDTGLITPYVPGYNTHIYHQYVLRVKGNSAEGKSASGGKKKIRKHLIKKGIDSRTYYSIPLHLQPCFKYLGYKKGDFPESERCAKETFAIPVHPELSRKQMDFIIAAIKEGLSL